MNKIYYVMIKGRTLESRNIKHLLARAVAEKRNLDRRTDFANSLNECAVMHSLDNHYRESL